MRTLKQLLKDALRKSALNRRREHEENLREKAAARVMICDTDKVGAGLALFMDGVPVFSVTGECQTSEKRKVTNIEALELLKELREAWVQAKMDDYDKNNDFMEDKI